MTKKDYELIAGVLRGETEYIKTARGIDDSERVDRVAYVASLASEFATALQPTNPRFDRERFIAAATGSDSNA